MNVIETNINGLVVLEPRVFKDDRGYFFESFNYEKLKGLGYDYHFIQDNQSKSGKGVIRGLHYQLQPYAQAKLVRVLEGEILDVAVDIRKNSPTFGKSFSIVLSADNNKQLLIPKGFAHGFSVQSNAAVVLYKCDNVYHPASERTIFYADSFLNIDWNIDPKIAVVSERDKKGKAFHDAEMNF